MSINYKYVGPKQFLQDALVADYNLPESLDAAPSINGSPEFGLEDTLQHIIEEIKKSRGTYASNIETYRKFLVEDAMTTAAAHNLINYSFPSIYKVVPGNEMREDMNDRLDPVDVQAIINELVLEGFRKQAVQTDAAAPRLPDDIYTPSGLDEALDGLDLSNIAKLEANDAAKASVKQAATAQDQIDSIKQQLNEMQENNKFDEQCFMMAFLNKYASFYRTQVIEKRQNKHILIAESNSSSPIVNGFSNYPDLTSLQNLTTDKLSYMYPKIELYKVFVEKTDKGFATKETKPFVFETSENSDDITNILQSNAGRGTGIGIKSFTWRYTGDNPATAQRLVEADLEIYIQDLAHFVRGFPSSMVRADYTDLISFSASKNSESQPTEKKSKLCDPAEDPVKTTHTNEIEQFEIEARVGWNIPLSAKEFFTPEELTAIRNNTTVIRLITKDYDFKFSQDGTVTLSIQYIGRLEGLLETNKANLFVETAREKEIRKAAEKQIKQTVKEKNDSLRHELDLLNKQLERADALDKPAIHQKINNIRAAGRETSGKAAEQNELMSEYRDLRRERFSALLEEIEKIDRIHYLKIDLETIANCIAGKKDANYTFLAAAENPPQPFSSSEILDIAGKAEAIAKKARDKASQAQDTGNNKPKGVVANDLLFARLDKQNNYIFPFIYVGDILEAAAKILNENMGQEEVRYRIITSSFVYRDLNCKRKVVNISDIPISLNVFTNWYTDNFTAKLKNSLPFVRFVRKLMSDLVLKALGKACFDDIGNNFRGMKTKINTITVSEKLDQRLQELKRFKIDEIMEDKNIPKETEVGKNYEYIVLSCDVYPMNFTGDRKTDEANGIMHMHIGRDRGLVKEIEFSKQSIPGLRESLITSGSPLEKLRLPFNTSVTMYGYPFIIPGCKFYVDPTFTGMGDPRNDLSVARKLGLGGYYVTVAVTNNISEGMYTTEINGQFESFPKEAPIILQEKDDVFSKSLDIGRFDPDVEIYTSMNSVTSVLEDGLELMDFDSPMVAANNAAFDAILKRDGLTRAELSPGEIQKITMEAYQGVYEGSIVVYFEENTSNVISVHFLDEEAAAEFDGEPPYFMNGAPDSSPESLPVSTGDLAQIDLPDRVTATQRIADDALDATEATVASIFEADDSGFNDEGLMREEVIRYYESANNIEPKTYSIENPRVPRDASRRSRYYELRESYIRSVRQVELSGDVYLEAVVVISSLDQGITKKFNFPYITPEARRLSNLLVVDMLIQNDAAQGAKLTVRSYRGPATEVRRTGRLPTEWLGGTPVDVRTRAKADIEAYYGGQVTYQYTETNNYRAGLSSVVEAEDARSRAQSAASIAREARRNRPALDDFRRPESRNLTREVYEDKLEILLLEEYLVYSDDPGRQWDERERERYYRDLYPYLEDD